VYIYRSIYTRARTHAHTHITLYMMSSQLKSKAMPVQASSRPLWFQEFEEIARRSAHGGGKVVSPAHLPPVPSPEIFLVFISVRR